MRAWWGALSLRARLAVAFGAMAAAALIFVLAIVARTLGASSLATGKILPAAAFALVVFFLGGWFVAEWCLREIGRLAGQTAKVDPKHLPAELEGLAALLRREAERRDDLLLELRRFTADAAHELRTPLTALRTTGEVALRGNLDAHALRDALSTMLEETQRMSGLLERLLGLARLESDAFVPDLSTLNLAQQLAGWREGLLVLAEEKQQRIEIQCAEGLTLVADASLLEHAAINILHNAIRHSPPGSVVQLKAWRDADDAVITIRDEGPGIAREHHEKIFQRFYRIDRSRGAGGTGLGLCIARTAVARAKGTLHVESAPGDGATFILRLPLVPPGT